MKGNLITYVEKKNHRYVKGNRKYLFENVKQNFSDKFIPHHWGFILSLGLTSSAYSREGRGPLSIRLGIQFPKLESRLMISSCFRNCRGMSCPFPEGVCSESICPSGQYGNQRNKHLDSNYSLYCVAKHISWCSELRQQGGRAKPRRCSLGREYYGTEGKCTMGQSGGLLSPTQDSRLETGDLSQNRGEQHSSSFILCLPVGHMV